jgi:protease-4
MKSFLIAVAGTLAGLILFFVGLPILFVAIAANSMKPDPPPQRAVIQLDLRQTLSDQDDGVGLALFQGRSLSVMAVTQTLREAETDPRVKGLLVRLPEGGAPPAAADEIGQAIGHFRRSGKPVIAHSQGLYPSGVAVASYRIGAAADQFWMQPASSLQAVGIASEDAFLKRLFDKYGVKADYQQRYEYKNAVNSYLYDDYTPAHREATLSWMNSVLDSQTAAAAADRRQAPAALKAALAAGPWSAEEAVAKKLIDRTGQVREAQAELLRRAGAGAKLVDFAAYRNAARERPDAGRPTIAVIGAEGAIVTGSSDNNGFGRGGNIYSDDLAQAFDTAARDKDVKAIVFRVSSPGGSDTASEQIAAGVRQAKAAGKPVVVSMGTYAASGGYWVSSEASSIVAEPSTLTGSIGVFGGKFVLGEALGRFGVDLRDLNVGGDYAGAFGASQPFTDSQRAAFAAWMDRIYEGFVQRVSTGRKLPVERVREIAKGRVWTGAQAQTLGLVDKQGGFYEAVDEAKRLGGVPASQDVRLKRVPGRKSPFEVLQRTLGLSAVSVRTLAAAAWVLGDPRAQGLLDTLAESRLQANGGGTVLAPTPLR